MKSPKISILYNSLKNKNSKKVAEKISKIIKNCKIHTAENNDLNLKKTDFLFFIVSNRGDEELPHFMENYFFELNEKNKKYFICELGNYFGFEYNGCKKIAIDVLNNLKWQLLSDLSVDSVPEIDCKMLIKWTKECKSIIKNINNEL